MTRYGNNILHWKTLTQLTSNGCYSGDESYEMFPDNTLIHCQLINKVGKNIKANGTFGNELYWCKVCDQRCFRKNILYAVKIIENGEVCDTWYSTRASQVNWPRPKFNIPVEFLVNCNKDDSITKPHTF